MSHASGPGHPTVIVGGGLTGISAALHAGRPYLLFEREETLGGLARTEERDGFYFDRTGHWLHLRDPGIKALAERVLGPELAEVERKARVYSHGALTLYPFQANLHGLPPEVVYECLLGLFNAQLRRGATEPRNFEQYVLYHFGEGIARHFMVPYNAKLWGVHPREITSAWCSRFVPLPSVEQVLAGALGVGPSELGYNVRFRYPRKGGIETFTRALVAELDPTRVHLRSRVEAIDPAARTVRVDGETVRYHALIPSLPLPRLVELLVEPPREVEEAAARLRATSLVYLNVATRRPCPVDYHWVYVPEERFPFYRVGVFSNAMPSMAPPGCASYYVELSTREVGPDPAAMVADAVRALVEVKAIASPDDVLFADVRRIDPAYVVFDELYESSVGTIQRYLEGQRIFSRGRYGAWIYNAMEDSLLAGRGAAEAAAALPAEG
ncbi:MAG: FAD-dependent oxidoreductase [Deltaproteobacteria bacterium]|nr:FAD-dependent oxidoreductase [Deltaproteobacteria bacterium]